MDPGLVGSSNFRTLWEFASDDSNELFLAKPLVYTPAGGSELIITSSEKNIIRIFDAKTGTLIKQRQLQQPFRREHANCGDIPNYIGITGTPLIDPATSIMYVMSKGYREGVPEDTINGIYKMYAIHIPSLDDVTGFPTLIDGNTADNDRARYFVGGVALQRPSLSEINGHIVAGFGSHCGRWNYTGYLVAVSKQPNVGVTSIWATEYPPGAPSPQPLDIATEQGGKAGIWQSGFGLPTIGNALYFTTGNGQGMHNGNLPANGRDPMSTLSHSTVRMELSADGKWSQIDYFQPYDYTGLNAADRDVGSGGFMILDPTVFKGTGVNRMGIIAGKARRAYVLNANDLGGFRNGPGGLDKTIQTIELPGSVYGGWGSYPHEGGYVYVTTIGFPLQAFRLGHDAEGRPVFSEAGRSTWTSAGRVGVGQMTVTSTNGQPGTGIVWITDVTDGLRAFKAVPENGEMIEIPLPRPLRGANKFQRPVFGDGRVYYQAQGHRLFCLGSPVAQAVTCSPVDFGSLELGQTTTATVSCTANAALTVTGCDIANPSFKCDASSLPSGRVAAGSSFTFGVSWDLETPGSVTPGVITSTLTLDLDVAAEFGSSAIVSLEGVAVSQGPFLHTTSSQAPFGDIVLYPGATTFLDASLSLENSGNGSLTILGVAAGTANISGTDLGSGFSSENFPAAGDTIASGERINIAARFEGSTVGDYGSLITVWSDGGDVTLNLTAGVRSPPIARFEVADGAGGWTNLEPNYSFSFGDVTAGESATSQIRVCNDGGSTMTITISKPPDAAQLFAVNPAHDLAEGVAVHPGACEIGNIAVRSSPLQPNTPIQVIRSSWALTTDGLNATTGADSGLHEIKLDVRVVPKQTGPLLANGMARYQYVGCFSDTSMGRNLQNQINTAAQQQTNTQEQCQNLVGARGGIWAGVQYRRECWTGNEFLHPQSWSDPRENRCTFSCMGDDTQACGGDGGYMSVFADSEAIDIPAFLASIQAGQSPTSSSSVPVQSPTSSSSIPVQSSTSSAAAPTTTSSVAVSLTTTSSISVASTTTSSAAVPSGSVPASPLNPNQPATAGNGKWEYYGCFNDLVDGKRSLGARNTASDSMSAEFCATFSGANGDPYNYFGLTYGRECFAGWELDAAALRVPEADCSSSCAGTTFGRCGGFRKLSVYRNVSPSAPPSGPEHVKQVGDYSWLGCYTTATTGRALTGKTYASDDMTVQSCTAFCLADNYRYSGIEYSRECRCGNTLNAGSVLTDTAQCSMLCKGNAVSALFERD
jgi:iron transport multicopper oxidase